MNNLTLLETIFIWYVIVVNIAVLIAIPFVLYFTFDTIKKNKRKKDLENKYDELFNNKGEDNE